ncbi:hypothetical protein PSI23_11085 [Xenorhabdus sp. XENO-10]|uniref:Uncharacterized protein n=1 Tax=Xenorhabdus yunnanensis TaxID=3025878 RepID=A0ABT5LFD4_9GAMM|nr:hypothetical protein [Xenorhabdus yunnanensis]MDC9589827.1 hypothetical protein [Xenorhabdus yunnanensis]
MFRAIVTFSGTLDQYITASENTLNIANGHTRDLDAVGVGNHTYLILKGPGRAEVVKYHHTTNYDEKPYPDTIAVERGIEGGRMPYCAGDCITFVWTETGILELLKQQTS